MLSFYIITITLKCCNI